MKPTVPKKKILWQDRKRTLFGLPLSFTRFRLYADKLIIDTGLLSRKEDEVRLYRIMDLTLTRTLGERLFRIGTIRCSSGDKTMGNFDIKHIKSPREVKELLSDMVEAERKSHRVGIRENMDGDGDEDAAQDAPFFDDDDIDDDDDGDDGDDN